MPRVCTLVLFIYLVPLVPLSVCVCVGGGGGWVGGGVWGWVGVGSLSSSMCIYMKVYFLLALVWLVSFGKCSS